MDTRIAGPALRAGIYVRISEDRNGDELGVARQEQDGRELAERRGWTVAGIYSDDDRSAYSGKVRPDYRRLLADVASGQLQAVVAWDPDRLYRRPDDLAEFVNVVEAAGAPVATCKAGDIDLTSANGRLVARLLGDVSAHSSEHAAERIKRKMRELAETGKDHGGRRPFGWERNRRTLRAPVTFCRVADRAEITYSEPAMIRDATARVLAGGKGNGLKTIVTDWNRHGWPSTTGGMWTAASLRRVLRSVRISGRAEYRGRIVAERTDWVAIISVEDSDKVRALLLDPARISAGRPGEYLLTGGIARCGRCGRPLVARGRAGAAGRRMTMECVTPKQSGGKSCGAITVAAEPVEAIVSEAVLRRVDGGALRALLRDRDDPTLLAELAKVERQLIENRRDYTDELITRPVWQDEHGRLTGRQKALTARLEAGRRRAGLEGLSEPLRDSWPSLPLARRRAVVRALVEAVTIAPATSRRFEPERVSVRWRA